LRPPHASKGRPGNGFDQRREARIGSGRLFISTEEDNTAMQALLPREGWTLAGSVAGANTGNRAEVFFYKDLGGA
jgi:hypothetical protein